MNINDILGSANIPPEQWANCHVTDDGKIFTPRFTDDDSMLVTGAEVYAEWLALQGNPPSSPPPDPRDLAIAQLMRDVAALKGGTANV